MTKPDWAERKAKQVAGRTSGLLWQEAAALLRAERRRAVRECHSLGKHGKHLKGDEMCAMYIDACSDCAQAIAGGK